MVTRLIAFQEHTKYYDQDHREYMSTVAHFYKYKSTKLKKDIGFNLSSDKSANGFFVATVKLNAKTNTEWVKLSNGSILWADNRKQETKTKEKPKPTKSKSAPKPKRKTVASQTTLPLRARKDTSKPQQRVTQNPYRPKKGTGQVTTGGGETKNIEKDMARAAKPVGRRISRKGKVYYEYRENRSDDSNGMSDYYGRMLPERIRKLKAENAYGVKYHGGELVTPEAKKSKKELSRVMLMKVVSRYERMHIHKQPIENLLYFDKYGNCISHSVGNQKSVSSDSYSGSSAIVVTHNHPSENGVYQVPHSADDIVVFLTQNTPIMRVCTYGVYFQYEKPFGEVHNIIKARNYAKAFNKIWEECIIDTIHKIAVKNKIFIKASFPKHRLNLSFDNRLKLPSDEYSRRVYEANVEIVKRANTSDYVNAHLEFIKYLKKNGVNNIKFTKGEL